MAGEKDELMDMDAAVAFLMRETGKSRGQARAMLLRETREGKLEAYFVPPGEDEDEAVRIPPEALDEAFPPEH